MAPGRGKRRMWRKRRKVRGVLGKGKDGQDEAIFAGNTKEK